MSRPNQPRNRARVLALVAAVALVGAACSGGGTSSDRASTTATTTALRGSTSAAGTTAPPTTPSTPSTIPVTEVPGPTNRSDAPAADTVAGIRQLLEASSPLQRFSVGDDRLGVWICHVGLDIKDPIYNVTDFRLQLTPDHVAELLNTYITPYYSELSHDLYHPEFISSGEVSISGSESNRDCVTKAQLAAPDDIDGLVVVADAEHGSSQAGGWGRPGDPCPIDQPCPARVSGRATYIGSSDFHPDWGKIPAVDLEEHELGHSLGFPHSGDAVGHDSALDLMSNSAAPRDVDPDRRNAPDTLGINRLAAGWLPLDSVLVGRAGDQITLVASNAAAGPRLLVLPLDGLGFLTVEVLDNTGFDDHLPRPGIAVHRIDQSAAGCRNGSNPALCLNELRRQEPLHAPSPYTDLLQPGGSWSGEGWTVKVLSAHDGSWTVQISTGNDTP